ncbi:TetR/AcrR family transcriptional regulator [Amycolatopsis jejuensis]|uniref:TetR/AcrR family transcriptional regulator n=1 Tax=Amycolatopsis jejuensis TaxID=330084 RepID=UPI0005261FDA|nr:TetR/AcrR family transcriptional regulator [Amycolatopsis jejuensis]
MDHATRARPRNRRALIVAAATDLMYRHGYDDLGMSDFAKAVEIGPSALYRHFTGKQDLLREVIATSLAPVRDLLAGLDPHDPSAVRAMASLALEHRHVGVCWQREARNLAPADLATLRNEVREIGRLFTGYVLAVRPGLSAPTADLLASSALAVLTSISFHRLDLPRPQYDEELAGLVATVVGVPLPGTITPAAREERPRLIPHSRREAFLAEATRRFATHGYPGVSMEDVGAALGLSGQSIYKHFPAKRDLLTTAFDRGVAVLFAGIATICDTAPTPADALRALIRAYLTFALDHHHLVGLMITELRHLDDAHRHSTRQAQHDYISEWVHLLREVHPGLDATTARIRVQATLSVMNNIARTPHLCRAVGIVPVLTGLCEPLLLG